MLRIRTGGSSVAYAKNKSSDDNLYNHFKNLKTGKNTSLSDISIKNYISKLNRISILINNKCFENDKFLFNPDIVIDAIENSNLKSKKDYISAISKYLRSINADKSIIDKYQQAMSQFMKKQTDSRKDNLATEENAKKSLSMREIEKRLNSFQIRNNEDLFNISIVAFYFGNTENLVPRNDLANIKIISPAKSKKKLDDNFNYLVVENSGEPVQIIFCSYKTSKIYGQRSFKISKYLKKILFTYIKKFNKKYNNLLFTRRNGEPFANSTFSKIIENAMTSILGKPIGVDLVRQIVATNFYHKNPLASKNQKEEFASRFLHSSATNQEYMRQNLKV